VIHL